MSPGTAIGVPSTVDGVVSVTVAAVLNGPRFEAALWERATDPIGAATISAQAPAARQILEARLGIEAPPSDTDFQ